MTWIVMCPNWKSEDHVNKPHGWSLSREELDKIGNRYFDSLIECIVCDHKFSLQQGVKEAFSSDIPFVIHDFQYNAHETGEAKVTVGQIKTNKFSKHFDDPPTVYLTLHETPGHVAPSYITTEQFSILSCQSEKSPIHELKVSWSAYGNRAYAEIPIWRKLISSSKGHQLRKDFRSELVDLESAFEVFIDKYFGKHLKNKLREETVNWMLKKFSIEEKVKIGFKELTGKSLSEMEPTAHGRWQRCVKELRDSVVHRGASVTEEQAREARDAVFDLMTRINPTIIEYFRIQVKEIRLKHPSVTFGTATIRGKK